MNAGNYITLAIFGLSLALAGLGAYYALHARVTKLEGRCENHQATIDSIATLNGRLDKIDADQATFWRILGPHLAGIIHSPKSRERDKLVDKLVTGSITANECRRLVELIQEAIDSGRWDRDKTLAGALLQGRAAQRLRDLEDRESRRYRRSA